MTKISEKISATLFGTVLAAALFLYLYLRHGYVFPFIEQNRMFLWDGDWVLRRMAECGGTAAVARDFVLQFFIEPWSGALITALLLAAVGVTMRRTLERVAADNGAWLLWLAPVAAQIFLTVDYDYRYEGLLSACGVGALLDNGTCGRRHRLACCFGDGSERRSLLACGASGHSICRDAVRI